MFNNISDGLFGLSTYVTSSPARGLHIAVKSNTAFAVNGLLDAGGDPLAKDDTGNTPIHTAASCGASVAIRAMLEHESCERIKHDLLTTVNNEGDTLLHVACKARQLAALKVLLEFGCDVHTKNNDGLTPIQCAVSSENADVHCIDSLLEHDAALVNVVECVNGNSLLHASRGDKQVVQCLLHHSIDTTKFNNAGQTALHKAAFDEDNPLEQVMSLLVNGVEVDCLDHNGDTPLHALVKMSAKKGSNREIVIKALVVFGADLNLKNRSGLNVYEAARAGGCRSTMTLLNQVGADDKTYLNCKQYPAIDPKLQDELLSDKVPRPRPKWNRNSAAVLALDGGGIRGLVLIQLLLELERRTRLDTTQLFDWIGGTSTGSMLSLALVYSKKTLRECQRMYFHLKDEVFRDGRPYKTEVIEHFFKDVYTEERVMSSVQFPRVLVPATIADCRPAKLHVFKNFGYRTENDCPPPQKQKVWEAARSSSAAPTYFTPHKKFVDGGLMANNPTIPMLTELHECNKDPGRLGYGERASPVTFTEGLMRAVMGDEFSKSDLNSGSGIIESRPVSDDSPIVDDVEQEPTKPYIVVSFGTGLAPEVCVKDYNVSNIGGPLGAGRFLLGVKAIVETMVEQCAKTDGCVVMGAKAWCESIGSYYFRLQPQLSYELKLDEADNKFLIECLWDVQSFIYNQRSKFQKLVDLLMSAF